MDMEEVVWIPTIEEQNEVVMQVNEVADDVVPISPTQKLTNTNNIVNVESVNSHAVAYTKLIPIGEIPNLADLSGSNSTLRTLFMENSTSVKRSWDLGYTNKHEFDSHIQAEPLETSDIQAEPLETLKIKTEQIHMNQDSHSSMSDHLSEETLSASEPYVDEDIQDFKPAILPDGTAVEYDSANAMDVSIKTETFGEEYDIKIECLDEQTYSCQSDADTTIKTEVMDFEAHDHEILQTVQNDVESTEKFLNNSPQVFTIFCGLSDSALFNALLEYISDDMKSMSGVTKYEQLFSVLTKLHKNEENFYLNKYIFPSTYVFIVELLYKKLDVLCKDLSDCTKLPTALTPEFDRSQKVVILGVLTFHVTSEFAHFPDNLKSVKYLIGYTAFGEVFFVSRAFVGSINLTKLIWKCGVLDKLDIDHWMLVSLVDNIYVVQVEKFMLRKARTDKFSLMNSSKVKIHTVYISNKLFDNFKVLVGLIPDFMLHSIDGICFLDKLVFVCCMLLNMLPLYNTYE